MRIGFIEDTPLHGGTQIWVAEALRYFLARGEDATLLCPEDSWMASQCAGTGARLTTYNRDAIVQQDAYHQTLWTEALRDCDVALCTVHPPREDFHCAAFAGRCIQEAKLKTHLISKTGTIVPAYRREFYLPDDRIASSVIAIANFTRKYLIENYRLLPEKVALIYQGTDIHRFQSTAATRVEALKRYPLPPQASPVLGCIGSFEDRKGQAVLFQAVSQLAASAYPNIHLLLVGDGPDEAKLRTLVKAMGLERHISFFPFTSEPEYFFERVDITALPSLYKEGLPNVLLESMAMKTPVIASDLGGVSEAVLAGETGFVVPTGDSEALAQAIHKLWADGPAHQEMRRRSRRLMEEKFDKSIQFARFWEYFKLALR